MICIESDEQFAELVNNSEFVVVDFFADWCGPCKTLTPKLKELSTKYENVVFVKVNVDDFEEITRLHKIEAMPTIHFYKNGVMLDTKVIGGNINEIEKIISHNL